MRILTGMVLACVALAAPSASAQMLADGAYRPDEVIVRFDAAQVADLDRLKAAVSAVDHKRLFRQDIWLLRLPGGSDVRAAEATLEAIDGVAYAHPNMIVRIVGHPNDPEYGSQWGFHQGSDADIDAPEAWDIHTDGSQTLVAVIDTGTQWDHPDLQANIWTNADEIPGNGIDDDANGYIDDIHGYDFVNDDGNPMDDHGHGTHCAGTVGADTNNGIGVAGTCWTAQIMVIKFLNSGGSGSIADSILAVEYAADNGADLSSNSWGCYCSAGDIAGLEDAIDAAGDQGHLFVAAAGNASSDNDSSAFYPATIDLPEVFSIAASNSSDDRASFSNYGATTVDIFAPGQDIRSTWIGSSYANKSGTSMACPHAAGAVTLLTSYCDSLTMMDAKQILMDTVDVLPSYTGLVVTDGRLNLKSALDACPPPVGVSVITPNGGELYYQGSSIIEWGTSDPGGFIDSVDLWLQDAAGNDISLIASGEADDGTYTWDHTSVSDGVFRVRVAPVDGFGDELASDNSDATFRVDRSTALSVLSPNGGELLFGVVNLQWSATDVDGEVDHIDLYLLDEFGVAIGLLSGDESNDGTWSWDTTGLADGTYGVRAQARNASDQLLAEDESDGFFQVDNSTAVEVLSPNGGEWVTGSWNIQWNASDSDSEIDHVSIWLLDASGVELSSLATDEPNDGSFDWDPTSLADGDYRIRVDAENGAGQVLGSDTSDGTCHVDHSTVLELISPNGKDSYLGNSIEIRWQGHDPDGDLDHVDLWLQDHLGNDLSLISGGETNDGVYLWDVSSLARGAYRIKVVARHSAGYVLASDNSDSPFVIGQRRLRNRSTR